MDVRVGSKHDPPGLPGLAHFCEHMLFLGSGEPSSLPPFPLAPPPLFWNSLTIAIAGGASVYA